MKCIFPKDCRNSSWKGDGTGFGENQIHFRFKDCSTMFMDIEELYITLPKRKTRVKIECRAIPWIAPAKGCYITIYRLGWFNIPLWEETLSGSFDDTEDLPLHIREIVEKGLMSLISQERKMSQARSFAYRIKNRKNNA